MSAKMRLVWLTVSKSLERSITIVDVWSGGLGRLKTWTLLCARRSRADMMADTKGFS